MLIKRIITYVIISATLFVLGYFIHHAVIENAAISLPYSLFSVYMFQAVATLFICVFCEIFSSISKRFLAQLGFIYLATMVLKIGLFCLVFNSIVFSDIILTKKESLSLLIPIFIYLVYEVIVITKILNRNA